MISTSFRLGFDYLSTDKGQIAKNMSRNVFFVCSRHAANLVLLMQVKPCRNQQIAFLRSYMLYGRSFINDYEMSYRLMHQALPMVFLVAVVNYW